MAAGPRATRKPRHPIESVNNALRLLLMFQDGTQIRISEASRNLGVVPSTAHRLMAMLEFHGFVAQDPETRAYQAGPTLTELGLRALRSIDSREYMRPFLARLAVELEETVHFLRLEGSNAVFVDGIESNKPVRTTLRVGDRRPAHCTSGGKAILAELSANELSQAYPNRRLKGCTPKTIRRFKDLEDDLSKVRANGYAISLAESEAEIAAIGVPIRDPEGRVIGAFSVSMPISRYAEREVPRFAAVLQNIARAVKAGFPAH